MKNRRLLSVACLALLPLALFLVMRARMSWRPRLMGPAIQPIAALAWSPDSRWVASGGETGTWGNPCEIVIWDAIRNRRQSSFHLGKADARWMQFSSDGQQLLVVDTSNTLHRADWRSGKEIGEPLAFPDDIFAISPNARIIAAPGGDDPELYRVSDGDSYQILEGTKGFLKAVAFSADGQRLAFLKDNELANKPPMLEIWKVPLPEEAPKNKPYPDEVPAEKPPAKPRLITLPGGFMTSDTVLFFSSQGRSILISNYNDIREYDIQSGQLSKTVSSTASRTAIAISSEGALIAETSPSGVLLRHRTKKTTRALLRQGIPDKGNTLAFSPDSGTLATGNNKGFVTLWRVR